MGHDLNAIFENPKTKEHWMKRGIALVIDMIAILVFYFISVVVIVSVIGAGFFYATEFFITDAVTGYISLLTLIFSFFYLVLMEVYFGGTIGKKMMGLRVEAVEGTMDLSKGIIRNITKLGAVLLGAVFGGSLIIVAEFIGLLFADLYFGTNESPDPRRKYTDIWAGTTVVRTDVEEKVDDLQLKPLKDVVPPPPPPPEKLTPVPDKEAPKELKIDETQSEMVESYMDHFDINKARAENLYKAGYRRFEDFEDAIVEDLLMVEGINPTKAREIVDKVSREPIPKD